MPLSIMGNVRSGVVVLDLEQEPTSRISFVLRLLRCFDLIITPKSLKFMKLRQSLGHHLKRKVMKSVDSKVCGLSTRSLFFGDRCLSRLSFVSAVSNTNTITPTVIY